MVLSTEASLLPSGVSGTFTRLSPASLLRSLSMFNSHCIYLPERPNSCRHAYWNIFVRGCSPFSPCRPTHSLGLKSVFAALPRYDDASLEHVGKPI